jgi:hypothetical protein
MSNRRRVGQRNWDIDVDGFDNLLQSIPVPPFTYRSYPLYKRAKANYGVYRYKIFNVNLVNFVLQEVEAFNRASNPNDDAPGMMASDDQLG